MADSTPPAGDGPGGARRKRPAPTLDLTATEIAREAAPASPVQVPEQEPELAKDAPPPATATLPADMAPPDTPSPQDATADPPAADRPSEADAPPSPDSSPPREAKPEDESETPPSRRGFGLPPDLPWKAFGAGAAGGAGVAAVAILLWLALPARQTNDALADRLAAIEARLGELAARPAPAPAAVDPKVIGALDARLKSLESVPPPKPAGDPALAERIKTMEGRMRTLTDSLAAADKRADSSDAVLGRLQDVARTATSDHAQLETLSSRIAALEKTDRALAESLAKQAKAQAEERSVRLAVASAALRSAAERNEPFVTELAAVRPLLTDPSALSVLEPFAASGIPSAVALGRDLSALLPAMFKLAGSPSRDSGFLDRLQANAEKLVRVRPVDETPGDSATAILSRVEIRAAHADIRAALAELAKLPDRVRAPARDWIARAEAHIRALDASRRIAADAVAALKPAP